MTQPHYFRWPAARAWFNTLFSNTPLYTKNVILPLDKSIADCFLFRPRKSCEKRRKRSHTNVSNASVTRTSRVSQTPLQTPIPYFHQWVPHGKKALVAIACKTAHVRFHERKRVHTLGSAQRIAHNGSHAETGAVSDGGAITTLGAFHTFRKPCVARCQNGKLCRFCALIRCAPEERREPSEQRCAYARRCSEAPRPHWAA